MKVKKNTDTPEFDIRERCSVVELLNQADVPEVSVARCRVLPGVTTELHALTGAHETYLILSGEGRVDDGPAGEMRADVGPDDVVVIPPSAPQRITNTGAQDLIFLAICTARFEPSRYVVLESGAEGSF